MQPQDYLDEIERWKKQYKVSNDVYVIDEMSSDELADLEKLDKEGRVWTEHSTCENDMITLGMVFYDSCCWSSYAFYVSEEKGSEEYVDTTKYLPCSVCNADGEDDDDPDCEGPEVPEGAETSDGCEEGWVQWYFN